MSFDPLARIAQRLAAPKQWEMIARYACGKEYRFQTETRGQCENHAIVWNRKIGRNLICRETGAIVRVVSVEIVALNGESA